MLRFHVLLLLVDHLQKKWFLLLGLLLFVSPSWCLHCILKVFHLYVFMFNIVGALMYLFINFYRLCHFVV